MSMAQACLWVVRVERAVLGFLLRMAHGAGEAASRPTRGRADAGNARRSALSVCCEKTVPWVGGWFCLGTQSPTVRRAKLKRYQPDGKQRYECDWEWEMAGQRQVGLP